jgi:hypothetical protein
MAGVSRRAKVSKKEISITMSQDHKCKHREEGADHKEVCKPVKKCY